VSDASGLLASPHSIIERSGSSDRDLQAIADLVRSEEGELVVVGVPVSLAGRSDGAPAVGAVSEADELARRLDVPVETLDERLTTVLATRLRHDAEGRGDAARRGARRAGAGRGRKGTAKRRPIDAEAAAVILQSWIDSHRDPDRAR
jgi:putative Holliday junction resolvase